MHVVIANFEALEERKQIIKLATEITGSQIPSAFVEYYWDRTSLPVKQREKDSLSVM